MTSLKEKMRRYLFPTYDESIDHLEKSQALGQKYLETYGFKLGDTVYLDGKIKGTIVDALADPYKHIPGLSLRVITSGEDAYQYLRLEHYKLSELVVFPCTIDNITKEPSNE